MKNSGRGTDPRYTISTLLIAGLLQMASIFSVVKEAGWIVVACSSLIIIPVCIMYGKLVSLAGGHVFTYAFGKVPGTVINAIYVLFFVFSASIDLRQVSNLISGGMFPGLSPLVLPLLFAPVLFYAAKKETKQVAYLGFILFVSAVILTVSDFLLQIPQIKFDNYLPIIDTSVTNLCKMLFYCVTVVMGKVPVVLFITGRGTDPRCGSSDPRCVSGPSCVSDPRCGRETRIGKGYGWGAVLGCLFLLLVAVRDVGILGVLVSYVSNSVFETVQLLDAFGFLSRVEILFIFMHVVCVAYAICLWTGASTDAITGTANLKNRKNTFVIAGIIVAIMVASVFIFQNSAALLEFLKNVFPYISVWFVIIIPVIALALAKIKSMVGTQR